MQFLVNWLAMPNNNTEQVSDKNSTQKLGIEYRFGCYNKRKPEACHLLGEFIETVKGNVEKAAIIFRSTCDDYKFGKSCYKYGSLRLLGKDHKPADRDMALNYFGKGCELGDADSCLTSGLMWLSKSPQIRTEEDFSKALNHLDKGCAAESASCCYYMSNLYRYGVKDMNVKEDMDKARTYSEKACEYGNLHACLILSELYRNGNGVIKSDEMAEKYKRKALDIQEKYERHIEELKSQSPK